MTNILGYLKSIAALVGSIATALLGIYAADSDLGRVLTVVAVVATVVATFAVPNLVPDAVSGKLVNVKDATPTQETYYPRGERGVFSPLYAASIALGFLALVFAIALLTGIFSSPVGWVGVVILAAIAIFCYYLSTGRGSYNRVR